MTRECDTSTCIVHTKWTEQASWMRQVGAIDAAWSADGQLLHLTLGTAPHERQTTKPESDTDAPAPAPREPRAPTPGLRVVSSVGER